MSSPAKRAAKWGDADKAKFRLLVKNKNINWKRNDSAYLRQVRDKHWPGRKTPTFKANWKTSTAEFRTAELLNGARERLEGVDQEDDAVADNIESDIEGDIESLGEVEEAMPPSAKKKSGKKTSTVVDATAAADEDLAKSVGQISIQDKPYSFDRKDPSLTKKYCKKNINYAEVDFYVGGIQPEHHFQVDLIEGGNGLRYQKATPEMFGETARLKKDMGTKWHEDDTRVVAHDNTVQVVRKDDKPVHKMYWGDQDAQIVPLPFKCRGKIKKSWNYYKTGTVIRNHQQYVAILTCRIEAAEQRNAREKKGKVSIHDDDLSLSSEESDSDTDDDDDESMGGVEGNARVPDDEL